MSSHVLSQNWFSKLGSILNEDRTEVQCSTLFIVVVNIKKNISSHFTFQAFGRIGCWQFESTGATLGLPPPLLGLPHRLTCRHHMRQLWPSTTPHRLLATLRLPDPGRGIRNKEYPTTPRVCCIFRQSERHKMSPLQRVWPCYT
jgi:hypothetical protein